MWSQSLKVKVFGSLCDPRVQVYTQGNLPIGVSGERIQWYSDLGFSDDQLHGVFEVQEGVQTWLSLDLEGKTQLLPLLNGRESDGRLIETINIEGGFQKLTIQRLSRIFGFSGAGRGKIDGEVVLDYSSSGLSFNMNITLPNAKLAKHRLDPLTKLHISVEEEVITADWLLDFVNKGDFEEVQLDLNSDDLWVSSSWQDVHATVLSIAVPDMHKEHGRLAGTVMVDGTLEEPSINALVQVKNLGSNAKYGYTIP